MVVHDEHPTLFARLCAVLLAAARAANASDEFRQESFAVVLQSRCITVIVSKNFIGEHVWSSRQIFGPLVEPTFDHKRRHLEVKLQPVNGLAEPKGLGAVMVR